MKLRQMHEGKPLSNKLKASPFCLGGGGGGGGRSAPLAISYMESAMCPRWDACGSLAGSLPCTEMLTREPLRAVCRASRGASSASDDIPALYVHDFRTSATPLGGPSQFYDQMLRHRQ